LHSFAGRPKRTTQAAQERDEIGANSADERSSRRETSAFLVWRATGRLSVVVAEASSFVGFFRHERNRN